MAVYVTMAMTSQGCASRATSGTVAVGGGELPNDAEKAVFQTTVAPQPDEDLSDACRYELTLAHPSRKVRGIWVIFERSRDTLRYYQDIDVRAFARLHDVALLFP